MASYIVDCKNAETVRNKMFDLKALLLPLCRLEEQNVFSKGLGSANHDATVFSTRAQYTRTHDRAGECELGKQYYDICQVLIEAFTKSVWIEPARVAALDVFHDIHGVSVVSQRTEWRAGRTCRQDFKFLCDWREELGIDMIVRITLKLTGNSNHVMAVNYIRDKAKATA